MGSAYCVSKCRTLAERDLIFKVDGEYAYFTRGTIMWFASHLCEKGVISRDQFAEAVQFQLSHRRPLGAIATNKGLLTSNQISRILSENALMPERCFGQAAIDLGYLTEEELAVLLYEQTKETPSLNAILVELGFVDRTRIATELHMLRGDMDYLSTIVPKEADGALGMSIRVGF
jgi:signal transduction histidine kinase